MDTLCCACFKSGITWIFFAGAHFNCGLSGKLCIVLVINSGLFVTFFCAFAKFQLIWTSFLVFVFNSGLCGNPFIVLAFGSGLYETFFWSLFSVRA